MADDGKTRRLGERKQASREPDVSEPAALPRYMIGDEIARGGMGRVVEATDSLLGRQVAVKQALATDRASLLRFVRETRITARLEHPAIVPLYDAGVSADGTPYYVMRKVSGEPLDKLVGKAATLGERLALITHVVAAANAVAHAHTRDVIHRDLKPSNILVGEFGEAVVIDWGLAKAAGEAEPDDPPSGAAQTLLETAVGSVLGTPGFMSPEQIAGSQVDARSDVHALGATLFFVLAGQTPHGDHTSDQLLALAAAGPPPSIGSVVPGVPRDLAWIVDKALAFDVAQRYAHAGELASDLQRFMTGQLVASREYSRRERFVRLIARHRAAAIVLASAVVVLAIGGAIAVERILDERGNTEAALDTALAEKRHADDAVIAMTLANARSLLETDPSGAVAVAKPLAPTSRWREVRAIAEQARTSGACWGILGPLNPTMLELAPDGVHLASVDAGGGVWFHDLAQRSSRELLRLAAGQARAVFADDAHLVAWDGKRIVVIELATGSQRWPAYPGPVDAAAATERAAFVISEGFVHRIAIANGELGKLDVAGAFAIAASPDRKRVAIGTNRELVIADDEAVVRLGTGSTHNLIWDASSRRVAAIQGGEIVLASLDGTPAIATRRSAVGVRAFAPMDRTLLVDVGGALERVDPPTRPIATGVSRDFGIAFTRGGIPVTGARGGAIAVAYDPVVVSLRAPANNLLKLAASPGSDYIVAATHGRLFVWDVRVALPKPIAVEAASHVWAAGGHELVLGDSNGHWRWFDVDRGAEIRFDAPAGLYTPVTNARGSIIALVPDARTPTAQFVIAKRSPLHVSVIGGQVSRVLVTDDRVIAGMPDGRIVDIDPKAARATPVIQRGGPVSALASRAGWRAARWTDGTMWRRGPDGVDRFAGLAAGDGASLHLDGDGRVWTSEGPRIVAWGSDGATSTIATLPSPIVSMVVLDDVQIVALADETTYRVSHGTIESLPVIGAITDVARDAGIVVASQHDGKVTIADVAANATWQLASTAATVSSGIAISADGRRIAIASGSSRLLVWPVDLPETPRATASFADTLTNATTEYGSASVVWR